MFSTLEYMGCLGPLQCDLWDRNKVRPQNLFTSRIVLWVDHKDRALLSPPLSARYSVVYRRYAQNAPENITLCIYLPIYIKNNKCSVFVYLIVFMEYIHNAFFKMNTVFIGFLKKFFYSLNTIWCLFRCIECPIRQKDCV